MIQIPYFMSNEAWYTKDENDDLILTDKAPQKAVDDYNEHRNSYIKRYKTALSKGEEAVFDFLSTEDNDWMSFPVENN